MAVIGAFSCGETHLECPQSGVAVDGIFQGGAGQGGRLLRDVSDAPARGVVDLALVRVQLAAQEREEARFPRAVRADQADPVARVERGVGAFEQGFRAAAERDLGESDHVGSIGGDWSHGQEDSRFRPACDTNCFSGHPRIALERSKWGVRGQSIPGNPNSEITMRAVTLFLALLAACASVSVDELSLSDLQFLNRITYGATARDLEVYRELGREGYLGRELAWHGDEGLPDEAASFIANLPVSRTRPQDLAEEIKSARRSAPGKSADEKKEMAKQLRQEFTELDFQVFERRTVRALYSPHQLQEMLTWFWFNHFNVFQNQVSISWSWCGEYSARTVRRSNTWKSSSASSWRSCFAISFFSSADLPGPERRADLISSARSWGRVLETDRLGLNETAPSGSPPT